jgi:hypothetical protein
MTSDRVLLLVALWMSLTEGLALDAARAPSPRNASNGGGRWPVVHVREEQGVQLVGVGVDGVLDDPSPDPHQLVALGYGAGSAPSLLEAVRGQQVAERVGVQRTDVRDVADVAGENANQLETLIVSSTIADPGRSFTKASSELEEVVGSRCSATCAAKRPPSD